MKGRVVKDCERDVKGIHKWECVGVESASDGDYIIWCYECGSLALCRTPKPRYMGDFVDIRRIQE